MKTFEQIYSYNNILSFNDIYKLQEADTQAQQPTAGMKRASNIATGLAIPAGFIGVNKAMKGIKGVLGGAKTAAPAMAKGPGMLSTIGKGVTGLMGKTLPGTAKLAAAGGKAGTALFGSGGLSVGSALGGVGLGVGAGIAASKLTQAWGKRWGANAKNDQLNKDMIAIMPSYKDKRIDLERKVKLWQTGKQKKKPIPWCLQNAMDIIKECEDIGVSYKGVQLHEAIQLHEVLFHAIAAGVGALGGLGHGIYKNLQASKDLRQAQKAGVEIQDNIRMVAQAHPFDFVMKNNQKVVLTPLDIEYAKHGGVGSGQDIVNPQQQAQAQQQVQQENNLDAIADRVIKGEFGTGAQRTQALQKLGVDPAAVQKIVNQKMATNKQAQSQQPQQQNQAQAQTQAPEQADQTQSEEAAPAESAPEQNDDSEEIKKKNVNNNVKRLGRGS